MRTTIALLLLTSVVWGKKCPEGFDEHEGGCSYIGTKLNHASGDSRPSVKPSDEKPPKNQQPEWERGGVKAQMLPVQTYDDKTGGTEKADQIRWSKANPYVPPAPEPDDTGKPPK